MKQQFHSLVKSLSAGLLEKEYEISLTLLCAIAGENLFMIGPPGVAKSMIANRICRAFQDASFFGYLMSRFSTPDELFGPVSIRRLKDDDIYERNVEGYLPMADVVFLDEIWKSGPGILNTLLTVMNEGIYRNGLDVLKVKMKLLVAASNELPDKEEGLRALWDRFLIRLPVSPVSDRCFLRLLTINGKEEVRCRKPITAMQYERIKQETALVSVTSQALDCLLRIRMFCKAFRSEQAQAPLYVSDRRWIQIVGLLKAAAYCNDRKEVLPVDCLLLTHCIWDNEKDIARIREGVVEAFWSKISEGIDALEADLERNRKELQANRLECFSQPAYCQLEPYVYRFFYYKVIGQGDYCIFQSDYQALGECEEEGICYPEPAEGRFNVLRVVRILDAEKHKEAVLQKMNVRLKKGVNSLFINGVEYPLLMDVPETEQEEVYAFLTKQMDVEAYKKRIGQMEQDLSDWQAASGIVRNLFVSEKDLAEISRQQKLLKKRMAACAGMLQKLTNPFHE